MHDVASPDSRLVATRRDVLRSPNTRRSLIGQGVSYTGTIAQGFAQVLLVLRISDSKSVVPLVIALQTLPLLVLGSWGGTIADRLDNRTVLIGTSLASGALAFGLGLLVNAERESRPQASCSRSCSARSECSSGLLPKRSCRNSSRRKMSVRSCR